MPITSSDMISSVSQFDGRIAYTEEHTDHTGRKHRYSYRVAAAVNALAVMAARATKIEAALKEDDRERLADETRRGFDPADMVHPYLTNGEALEVVVRTAKTMPAEGAIVVATFIDESVTNAQLDNVFNQAKRILIRERIASILGMKPGLVADQALREEI